MKTGIKSYSLDTNIIIDLFKGNHNIADQIDKSRHIYLPITTLAELYLGVESSKRKMYHYNQVNNLLNIVTVINTTEQTARIYSKIKTYLKRKGTPIPENDIWIAALTKEHNLCLVTRDKHFKLISDLEITAW